MRSLAKHRRGASDFHENRAVFHFDFIGFEVHDQGRAEHFAGLDFEAAFMQGAFDFAIFLESVVNTWRYLCDAPMVSKKPRLRMRAKAQENDAPLNFHDWKHDYVVFYL